MTLHAGTDGLVSVIIPTRDRAALLREAIDSCLVQCDVDLEVIIVDDGSRDGTPDLVARCDHPALRYHRTQTRGAAAARNTGLDLARGQYVKFLDDDDTLVLGALARQRDRYRALDDPRDIVTGDFLRCNASLTRRSLRRAPARARATGGYDLATVLFTNPMTACPLYPRAALAAVGGFDASLPILQDYDIAVRLALAGYRFRYFPDRVYHWRIHRLSQRISDRSVHETTAQAALVAHHQRLLARTFPDGVPDDVTEAFARRALKTALRVAHSGDPATARRLTRQALDLLPRPSAIDRLKIALARSGLATLAGHLQRRLP